MLASDSSNGILKHVAWQVDLMCRVLERAKWGVAILNTDTTHLVTVD